MHISKPEVLSPAGDLERLQAALLYGADAVYLAGTSFGMRAASANFDNDNIKKAIELAHNAHCRVYVTCNILPRNNDIDEMGEYLRYLNTLRPDALIVADLGAISLAKR